MWSYTYTDELYHYGRKGMKWYQNIFTKGKNRKGRSSGDSDNASDEEKRSGGSRSSGSGKKSVRDMSDEELVKAINRARMEDTYHALRPEQVSLGKKFVRSLTNDVLAPAAISSGERFLKNALDKLGDKILKDQKEEIDPLKKLQREYDIKKLKNDIANIGKPKDIEAKSWEDMIKKQTYEKNKRNQEHDDLYMKLKTEKLRKEYEDWKNQNGKSSGGSKTSDSASTSSKPKNSDAVVISKDMPVSYYTTDTAVSTGKSVALSILDDIGDGSVYTSYDFDGNYVLEFD